MPTYEWRCDSCDESIEEFLPISKHRKHTNKKCKNCNEGRMRPVLGTGGFILEGSGWPGKGDI